MSESVYKIIELVGTSTESWEKAAEAAVNRAAASLRDLNIESNTIWERFKRAALGGEFKVSEVLRLRLGYNYDLNQSLETTADNKFGGVSAGVGIFWKKYRFDYSYSNFNFLGNVHRFGIWGTL